MREGGQLLGENSAFFKCIYGYIANIFMCEICSQSKDLVWFVTMSMKEVIQDEYDTKFVASYLGYFWAYMYIQVKL